MIDKVLRTIEKHSLIEKGDSLVIGVSGGPDSVCLLHILWALRESMGLKLFAVHVNHMLRREESDEDEKYVVCICDKLNIPLKAVHINIKKLAMERRLSIEETARIERYRLFDATADAVCANRIAVAHNKNDQTETVLMNIIRGAGLDGLKGMDYLRGRIIRPLLDIERVEIEDYSGRNGLNPRIDSSNLENIFTRNRVRLDLIPYIDKLFDTDIVHSISKMADLIRSDNSFIEQQIDKLYNEAVITTANSEILLDLAILKDYHIAAIRRIIRNSIKEVKGNIKGIGNIHIDTITDLIEMGGTGSKLHLPGGIRVMKSYGTLKIYLCERETKTSSFYEEINIPGTTVVNEINASIDAVITESSGLKDFINIKDKSMIQYFDYDRLNEGINVRNRKDGDVFKPLKSKGTKKLKEFFIDNKVPRELRDGIPLISKEKEIIWIIGYKISDKFKVTENTKRVLMLSFKHF